MAEAVIEVRNKFGELKEEDKDSLKNAIIKYSENNNVEIIYESSTSNFKVTFTTDDTSRTYYIDTDGNITSN